LLDGIRLDDPGGAEDIEGPRLAVFLHEFQQAEGPAAVEEEVFVQDKEGADGELLFHAAHDGKELVAGFIEVDEISLAPKEGRGRAEIASHRTAHRGDQDGGGVPLPVGEFDPHHAGTEAGKDQGMVDRRLFVLPEKPPEPADTVPPDYIVGVDAAMEVLQGGDVTPDDNGRPGLIAADQVAHLPHLADIGKDGTDPDDVVVVILQLPDEILPAGKIQDRAGGPDIGLNHEEPEGPVEHPQGKAPLKPGYLIVIQLHRIVRAAPILVVLGVGTENAGEEDVGISAQGMDGDFMTGHDRSP